MSEDIDLQHALARGHDLAVLEDGRTVPMHGDADGDARLYYDMRLTHPGTPRRAGSRRGWYYRANGRWCADHGDDHQRRRHPRVVATLASAGADDEIVLDNTTPPETARKIGRLALRYGMNPDWLRRDALHGRRPDLVTGDDVGGHDERDALQPGDYVLFNDLDGPEHLARVAQAMLTGYPGARRTGLTAKCLDEPEHDWRYHNNDDPLAVGIDSRDDEVWGMPADSNGLKRRRSPDDVLHAVLRVNGRRVVTRYPAPDDEVGIAFVDTGGRAGPRTVRAAGRAHDGTPCVWLDGDDGDAFRWNGNRYTYCDEGNIVLVEHGED